jgi:hypothetical protein
VSKGHRQRKISIEDGAARVRRETPSWTLRSCAIRSLGGERTRVQASGDEREKGGVDVADSIHLCDYIIYIY